MGVCMGVYVGVCMGVSGEWVNVCAHSYPCDLCILFVSITLILTPIYYPLSHVPQSIPPPKPIHNLYPIRPNLPPSGKPEHVINFFFLLAEEIREYMAALGVRCVGACVCVWGVMHGFVMGVFMGLYRAVTDLCMGLFGDVLVCVRVCVWEDCGEL